jgi:ABC-2 type transport system permease protein
MNTPSDPMAESEPRSEEVATPISPVRRLSWSVRRELWENRSIYLAPAAVGAVFLVGFLLGLVRLPHRMRAALALGPMEQHQAIQQPYLIVALMLMVVELVVAVFYCLDALYGERRDRSILFWKSMPVSDLSAVLAKASIPVLVLPLVCTAVTVAAQFSMLLASSAVLAASGTNPGLLWTHVRFLEVSANNLGHLVVFHGIWYAPLYGWLLLASAWARRAPFLWAALPPVAIGVVEKLAFNTSHFAAMVQQRLIGGTAPDAAAERMPMTMDMLAVHPGHLLISPGLWIGLGITALFLFAAVRLRRDRGPI